MKEDIEKNAKEMNKEWQDLVDHCMDLYDTISESEYRQEKLRLIQESHRIYQQKEKKTSFPWTDASNVVLPMTTITVDNLEPRLVAGLTGKKPVIQFEMPGLTEKDEFTVIVENWFNEELENVMNVQDIASSCVHKALIEGTVYPIASYDESERIVRDFVYNAQNQISIDPQTQEVMTEDKVETIFQGGKIEYAEFSDIFVSDDCEDWESADVLRIVRPTYAELQRKKDKPGYLNIGPWLIGEESDQELSEDQQSPAQIVDNVKITGKETIECLECCVSYVMKKEDEDKEDVKDWTEERYVATIALDSKIIIRLRLLREINFKNENPVKRIRLFKEKGKAYGTSVYEKIMSIQNGTSDLFNLVVNVATITMIPWFLYTDSAGLDSEATITPGKGIKVDDTSAVSFPKFNQNPRSYIVFIEMFMSLWEKLGSIGDIQIGRLAENRKDATATETMAAIQEGNIKHNYQSFSFKDDFLKLIRTVYDLYYQKMPFDKTFTHRGQPVNIPRIIMKPPFKFRLVGSTDMSNKVLEMQKEQQFFQMVGNHPMGNPIESLKDMVKLFKPDSMPEKYVNPMINQLAQALQQNPELPQVIQQYLQQKQGQVAKQQQGQQINQAKATGESMADAMMTKLQQVGARPNA